MSIDEKLGRLLAYAEQADERLDRIEHQLPTFVTRTEFVREVQEHSVLHKRINEVKSQQDQRKWLSDIGSKAVWAVIALFIGAAAAAIGLK